MKSFKNKKYVKGFTLIEVMMVVAILGIVSAIAVPSYVEYVKKGKRTDGKVELLRIAQIQESFFVQNLTYANSLNTKSDGSGLGMGADGTAVKSEQEEYNITLDSLNSADTACSGLTANACTSYTLTAVPQGGQAKDSCEKLTLTNTGLKGLDLTSGTATAAQVKSCWK